MLRKSFVFPLLFILFFTLSVPVFAQGLSGVANNMVVNDSEVRPGDILVLTEDGLRRASEDYDEKMFGVYVEFPVISVGGKTDESLPVLSSGRADVRVSAASGAIVEGDFITSSQTPGVGRKADITGFVLGKALASYDDTSQVGLIPVLIDIGVYTQNPNVSGLLGQFLNSLSIGLASTESFPLVLRYISAAVIGAVTFIIASVSFVRFMRSGLEAIGRNPLAKSTIVAGMVVNAGIVLVMALAGFGIAIAIILF